MRPIALLLILTFVITPVVAETAEAASFVPLEANSHDFYQELDITFWQTLPFAAFWGHFVDSQVSNYLFPGTSPHWDVIVAFATIVSAGNAYFHARKTVNAKVKFQ